LSVHTGDSRGELNRFSDLDAEFEILRELGRGGTAVVYLARERALDRHVAIKVIRAAYVEDESAAARLIREARTVAQLQHPNIVMLYGTRRLGDGSLALIMQYVSGRTLKEEIRASGALPLDHATQILRDLARALECAHRQRIVHRDIKPENIYLNADTGAAQLSDFGIARPWDTECSLTLPGMAIGTPAYMSPEQIDGGVLDGRSDIYSLGLVAYEMLTGRSPWSGETIYNTIYKQKHEDLPAIDVFRAGVPRALLEAVERALRKNPDERWASADAVLAALNDTRAKRRGKGKAARSRRRRNAAAALPVGGNAPAAGVQTVDPHATVVYRRDGAIRTEAIEPQGATPVPAASTSIPDTLPLPVAAPIEEVLPEPGAAPLALERFDRVRKFVVAALLAGLVIGTPMLISAGPLANGDPAAGPATVETSASPGAVTEVAAAIPSPAQGRGTAALAYPVYGESQTGVAGDTLPAPLVLRVEDAAGGPVANVAVEFAVVDGAGHITPARAVTDEHGLATARWLPEVPGAHRIEARPEGTTDVISFHAQVLPRPAAVLSDARGRDAAGAAGSRLAVRVDDDRGQPVAGARVRFTVRSGGGRIEPAVAETDAQGLARAQWVHGRTGSQQAEARVQDVDAAGVVVFSAEAEAAPARVAIRSGVAVGGTHTCVLDSDGAASCWGGNDSGQLGEGGAGRRPGVVRVAAPEPFADVAAGLSHSCAVGVSGSAFCWGANTSGQLGDGTRVGRGQPVRVQSSVSFTRIFAGMSHSCALGRDSRLYCWGDNAHGQLGDGSSSGRATAGTVGGGRTYRTATVGWAHTCALTADGRAWCWGRNAAGELGDGSRTDRARPVAVVAGGRFTDIVAGSAHTCGLRSDGVALCWGQNAHGQLGTGTITANARPVEVAGPEPFTALSAGGVHSCALGRSGAAYCWGRNMYGQLGDGSTENRAVPVRVATELRFRTLQASGAHTCGRTTDGTDYCWGYNIEGQLGNGTRNNQTRPSRVARNR
jgi:alpha-tubulin suppressor-like RCC1 family protein/tRNA A-37 threonylcarbamoyl transferase component Bud32